MKMLIVVTCKKLENLINKIFLYIFELELNKFLIIMNPYPKQSWRNVEENSTDLQKVITDEDYVNRKSMLEVFDFQR